MRYKVGVVLLVLVLALFIVVLMVSCVPHDEVAPLGQALRCERLVLVRVLRPGIVVSFCYYR